MPVLGRLGLLVLAAGLIADLTYHSLPLLTGPVFGNDGVRAHLVVFIGMLLVVGGLVQQGLRAGTPGSYFPRRGASDAYR